MDLDRLREIASRYPIIWKVLYPAIVVRRASRKRTYACQKQVIDKLGDVLVGDPIIRVDEFKGIYSIGIHSDLFYRAVILKSYEPQLVRLCLKYLDPKRDAIDVGANVGFYTVLFAGQMQSGKVLAIEPTGHAVQRLRRNLHLNGVAGIVDVYEGAVSDRTGKCKIRIIRGREEYSSIGAMDHPSISGQNWVIEEVMSTTLDDVVKRKSLDPGFVKIDVEGAEGLVFSGAENVLRENRPIILSELSDFLLKKNGSSSEEIIHLIKSHDYMVYDTVDKRMPPGAREFGDILCIPQEMSRRNDV